MKFRTVFRNYWAPIVPPKPDYKQLYERVVQERLSLYQENVEKRLRIELLEKLAEERMMTISRLDAEILALRIELTAAREQLRSK